MCWGNSLRRMLQTLPGDLQRSIQRVLRKHQEMMRVRDANPVTLRGEFKVSGDRHRRQATKPSACAPALLSSHHHRSSVIFRRVCVACVAENTVKGARCDAKAARASTGRHDSVCVVGLAESTMAPPSSQRQERERTPTPCAKPIFSAPWLGLMAPSFSSPSFLP